MPPNQLRDELARPGRCGPISAVSDNAITGMRVWLESGKDEPARRHLFGRIQSHRRTERRGGGRSGSANRPCPRADLRILHQHVGQAQQKGRVRRDRHQNDSAQGRIVCVKDIGWVEDGALSYDQVCTLDGKTDGGTDGLSIAGKQRPGNGPAWSGQDGGTQRSFPPNVDYTIVYDTTPFITIGRRGETDADRSHHPRRDRDARLPAKLALGDHPARGGAGGRDRHLRGDGHCRPSA